MTIKASTGLRNKLLDTNPLKTIFTSGKFRVYDGPVPASADDALDGANHLLLDITGLAFGSASGGSLPKSGSWSATAGASGTASFYRLVETADAGDSSTTAARVQGGIGTSGADLNMTSVSLTSGNSYTIDAYAVGIPTL